MEKQPVFQMHLFVAMGLGKGMYFELDQNLTRAVKPGYHVYKLFKMKRGKPGGFSYFYIPEQFNFILVPAKKYPALLTIRRRDILKLRKNNPIKSTYRKLRAITLLQPWK